jgi:hypothetical protein
VGAITEIGDVRRAKDRDNYREYLDVQRERVKQREEYFFVIDRGLGKDLREEDRKQAKLDEIDIGE